MVSDKFLQVIVAMLSS